MDNVDYYTHHSDSSSGEENVTIVEINNDRPDELLEGGHHFNDAPVNRRIRSNAQLPMDRMFDQVRIFAVLHLDQEESMMFNV